MARGEASQVCHSLRLKIAADPSPWLLRCTLDAQRPSRYAMLMMFRINIGDRARLRERFFGAAHAVTARLRA